MRLLAINFGSVKKGARRRGRAAPQAAPPRSGGLDVKAAGGRYRRRLPCDVDEHGAESAFAWSGGRLGVPLPAASGRESQERARRNGGTTFRRESVGHAATCSVAGRVRPAVHPGAEHAAARSVLRGRGSILALVWVERHDDPQCATRSASTKPSSGSCQSPNVRTGTPPSTRSPPARRRRRRDHQHRRFRHLFTTSPPPTSPLPSTSTLNLEPPIVVPERLCWRVQPRQGVLHRVELHLGPAAGHGDPPRSGSPASRSWSRRTP